MFIKRRYTTWLQVYIDRQQGNANQAAVKLHLTQKGR